MKNEAAKLRRELERYRILLGLNTSPHTARVLRKLVAQTEARLREIASCREISVVS